MPIKRYKPEQIVTVLRQIEVELANGKATPQACKEAEIPVQSLSFAKTPYYPESLSRNNVTGGRACYSFQTHFEFWRGTAPTSADSASSVPLTEAHFT